MAKCQVTPPIHHFEGHSGTRRDHYGVVVGSVERLHAPPTSIPRIHRRSHGHEFPATFFFGVGAGVAVGISDQFGLSALCGGTENLGEHFEHQQKH